MIRDRKPEPWALAIVLTCLAACGTLRADDPSGGSLLTVGRLFGTKEFDTESLPARRWSKRSSTYLTLEKAAAGTGSEVVRTDPATGTKEVVVPASAFLPNGAKEALAVESFEFSADEQEILKGAVHPLVRTIPRSQRKSLYIASHASRVVDWPVPEGRLLLRNLMEHATQAEFVYRHAWRVGDFVIWDNRATMHRARPFDDTRHRRELRRVTTLDIPELAEGLAP